MTFLIEYKKLQLTSATRQMRRLVVFGRRFSARFPCPAGQEIARNPPLRVASYVVGQFIRSLKQLWF